MNEECLICKASLEYLEADTMMECVICHKKENSKTRCVNGHYVCSECHTSGMDEIIALALNEKSKNPTRIINALKKGVLSMAKTKIAFICVHNSCRSQMAEAFGKVYLSDKYDCYSAGTETKPEINQEALRIMKEHFGIDIKNQYSKLISDIPAPDIVITMGCNVHCPNIQCKEHYDWGLDDPTGKSDEEFIKTANKIKEKILELRR